MKITIIIDILITANNKFGYNLIHNNIDLEKINYKLKNNKYRINYFKQISPKIKFMKKLFSIS